MRRNRKNNIRRERIIMIASSAFVLAALTMTGVYMKEKNTESENDGYTVDFTELENNVDQKYREIVQAEDEPASQAAEESRVALLEDGKEQTNMENDLDYMPMEAGSSLVEIPGLTDGQYTLSEENTGAVQTGENREAQKAGEAEKTQEQGEDAGEDPDGDEDEDEETAGNNVTVKELHFAGAEGFVRPTSGEVLMPYSMDAGIYFATLDQYKYNPAVVFSASEGSSVSACAEGKIVSIYEDARIGRAVAVDLGDGYQATYGQLKDIQVQEGGYVSAGDVIGSVAAPTKYFSLEGSNLYFQLTKNGEPVNPEEMF